MVGTFSKTFSKSKSTISFLWFLELTWIFFEFVITPINSKFIFSLFAIFLIKSIWFLYGFIKKEPKGRTYTLTTTTKFIEYFGKDFGKKWTRCL